MLKQAVCVSCSACFFNHSNRRHLAKTVFHRAFWNTPPLRVTPRIRAALSDDDGAPLEEPLASGAGVVGKPVVRERWIALAGQLLAIGCVLGPPLDGIHSRVGLVVYDQGAISIGNDALALQTNIWVFPLLATFYASAGVIDAWLDRFLEPPAPPSLGQVALSLGVLAVLLDLSAELYVRDFAYGTIWPILAVAAAVNWASFDRTGRGLALAALIGIVAPLAEVPIMKLFELWHYPKPDFYIWDQGQVSWVLNCYFFYTPFLLNLARYLRARLRS